MRRILITAQVEQWADEYADNMIKGKGKYKKPKDNLENLSAELGRLGLNLHKSYVDHVKNHLHEILTLQPSHFNDYYKSLNYWDPDTNDDVLYKAAMKKKVDCGGKTKEFYNHLIDAMRYDYAQEKVMPNYIDKMHIKSCVYCNAQFAVTTDPIKKTDKNGQKTFRRYAHYELDHFKAKSVYPFLCASFFNLQPSCSNCNKHKSTDDSLFCLYSAEVNDLDVMQFQLDPQSVLDYKKSWNSDDLIINLRSICGNDALIDSHQKIFHIDEVYAHHKDVAAEAVCHQMLSKSEYMAHMQNAYKSIFPTGSGLDLDVLFYGHHVKLEDTHKRPLNKLVADIKKTL